MLEALQFIHSLRLIHCDIKPENIVMQSYSRCLVKVCQALVKAHVNFLHTGKRPNLPE